jgi:hypothetical protein
MEMGVHWLAKLGKEFDTINWILGLRPQYHGILVGQHVPTSWASAWKVSIHKIYLREGSLMKIMKRKLGRTGIEVSAIGLRCWAIGGQMYTDGKDK